MTAPLDEWLHDSSPVPLARRGTPVRVYRLEGTTYEELDNLEVVEISQSMGIDPGRASFRYRFTGLDEDAPQSIEDCLSTESTEGKVVLVGDRIVVKATKPDGTDEAIFDGTPLNFGMNLGPRLEEVRLVCVGAAKEAWNTPVGGLYIRDGSDPHGGDDVQTDLPAQFNPKGKANATIEDDIKDVGGTNDHNYPTFIDPEIIRTPAISRKWTLAMAARYLAFRYLDLTPDTKLKFPGGDDFDTILIAQEPVGGAFDPADPSTWTAKDIDAPDTPLTGRDWPSLLNNMVRDKGFAMWWNLVEGEGDDGTPATELKIGRLQTGPHKDVYLQKRGENLDPEKSNIHAASIHRDINQVVNRWTVDGAPIRYEASFVLAPAFPMASSDAASADSLDAFDKSKPTFADHADSYRVFVLDETDEGHYANGSSTKVTTVPSLDDILGAPDADGAKYARRRRKPIGSVVSTTADNTPRRATLAISTDSTQSAPGIWDRTGHWQQVSGGWALLHDRMGVRLTVQNPNSWKIGKSEETTAPYPAGVVKVVESLATTTSDGNPPFKLRLTVAFDGDKAVQGVADRTDSSPIEETITRSIDARDRHKKTVVTQSSEFNDGGPDITVRDDSDAAKAEAIAARVASEAGILDGEITIPRFTRYYEIGDRIRQINGRDLGLRTDGSGEGGNAPIYPVVVGIRHQFEGGQTTTLQLSDQDGHRYKIESKTRRK